ncbi:organic cation transporter protein-like [Athalia rosae]|uniref:organic cation transporter protein-like n=1 Tax=Athalia rosae TaxID=37344 RepID=UPI0020336E35|nr:organic cation transporter protein-like [Athalia rosae]
MTYDEVLSKIGEFGRYHRIKFLLFCLTATVTGFNFMSGVFLGAVPDSRCLLPGENIENVTYELPSNISSQFYPWDDKIGSWSQCEMYDIDGNSSLNTSTVKCDLYVYDTSTYELTTTTDFHLVCDKAWVKTTTDALFMVGVMLGAIIFGASSDKWGRKLTYYLAIVGYLIGAILVFISPEFISFTVDRMISGATCSGIFLIGYVNALEMVGRTHRKTIVVGIHLSYTFGYILLIICAFFLRTWRYLQIAAIVPGVLFLFYWPFIPESARWLLTKNRREQAIDILHEASKVNGKETSRGTLDRWLGETASGESKKLSTSDFLNYPNMRNKSLVLFFSWFINSGTYYGLSWNTSDLAGDDFANALISAVVEIPAHVLVYFTLNRWGRKTILIGCMFVAGISLLVTIFIPSDMQWLVVVFAMMGKLAITASYESIYVFTSEQYPTVIRNAGIGACSMCARMGGIVAPYINYSSTLWVHSPRLIFGCSALLAGLLTMILPETLNANLPDTMEDGEQFGRKPKKAETSFNRDDSLTTKSTKY